MHNKHVVIEKNAPTRWYDNPDISDFMLALFGLENSNIKYPSLCLHTYDKTLRKGLNKFRLNDDNGWYATELVEDLSNRILYHPILTVSTTDHILINNIFENILDGIDGVDGDSGVPSVIIIPILMHKNHFGTLAIRPSGKGHNAEIYYFNSLGARHSYNDEEEPIFSFLKRRYGITKVVYNNAEQWQTDINQCGPYSIWFVEQIAHLVTEGNLNGENVSKLLSNKWKMGVGEYVGRAIFIREEQARILEGLNTNFSTSLFLDFKSTAKNNSKWHENWIQLSFENLSLHKPLVSQKTLVHGDKNIRDYEGVDAFELQSETQAKLVEYLEKPTKAIGDIPSKLPLQETVDDRFFTTVIAYSVVGALIGAALTYKFKINFNLEFSNMSSSYLLPLNVTSPVIKNAIVGGFMGLFSGIVVSKSR